MNPEATSTENQVNIYKKKLGDAQNALKILIVPGLTNEVKRLTGKHSEIKIPHLTPTFDVNSNILTFATEYYVNDKVQEPPYALKFKLEKTLVESAISEVALEQKRQIDGKIKDRQELSPEEMKIHSLLNKKELNASLGTSDGQRNDLDLLLLTQFMKNEKLTEHFLYHLVSKFLLVNYNSKPESTAEVIKEFAQNVHSKIVHSA